MLKKEKQVPSDEATQQKPLRLWPGVLIVMLQWLVRFGIPAVIPGTSEYGIFGGLLGGLAILVWWGFFSRAPRLERWGAIVLMIVTLIATSRLVHESVETGMRGMMLLIYAIPVLSLAFVLWAVASVHLSAGPRLVMMVASIMIACGVWTLVRSDGITGEGAADFMWRWAETPEERFLARDGDEPLAPMPVPAATETGPEWSGFRGANRDGIISGVRIETDWSASPPVELWRRPIGPGCSSFAHRSALLITQEQRGDNELVTCYNITTGEPLWIHRDTARFWD